MTTTSRPNHYLRTVERNKNHRWIHHPVSVVDIVRLCWLITAVLRRANLVNCNLIIWIFSKSNFFTFLFIFLLCILSRTLKLNSRHTKAPWILLMFHFWHYELRSFSQCNNKSTTSDDLCSASSRETDVMHFILIAINCFRVRTYRVGDRAEIKNETLMIWVSATFRWWK